LELLDGRAGYIDEKYGVRFEVIFATDVMRGTAFSKDGLAPGALLSSLERGGSLGAPAELGNLLSVAGIDILCEATPTNYATGEPGMSILRAALSSGVSAVTSSKGALALDMAGLKRLAAENGASLRFESSVMSGTPLISLVRGPLAGCEVTRAEGILNGTTNYILTQMESGMDYGTALEDAQRLGYAEADPTGDVEGFDAAVKVCIMAAEFFGAPIRLDEVSREGITGVTRKAIYDARSSGGRIKLIAGVRREGGEVRGYVSPKTVGMDNPLASVAGATNAVNITTDNLGVITMVGPGAGKKETAQGLMSDMLDIARR
jgi:homoserine dehydrogenase